MEHDSEYHLVGRARNGDLKAFEEIVEKYKKQIYAFVYNLTGNHADADDLSQETFLKAYSSLKNFKQKSALFTWLYRIALNTTLNHLKKESRVSRIPLERASGKIHNALRSPDYENPRENLSREELRQKIKDAIRSLPFHQRAIITLADLQGMSRKEIARIQRCPEGTVSWRLFRARRTLARKLKPYLKNGV